MRPFAILVMVSTFGAASARAGIITAVDLHADSHASFTYLGTQYQASSSVNTIDFSSSQALAGNNNTPEARTAARVGGDEIAVNARLDGKHLFAGCNHRIFNDLINAPVMGRFRRRRPEKHVFITIVKGDEWTPPRLYQRENDLPVTAD